MHGMNRLINCVHNNTYGAISPEVVHIRFGVWESPVAAVSLEQNRSIVVRILRAVVHNPDMLSRGVGEEVYLDRFDCVRMRVYRLLKVWGGFLKVIILTKERFFGPPKLQQG